MPLFEAAISAAYDSKMIDRPFVRTHRVASLQPPIEGKIAGEVNTGIGDHARTAREDCAWTRGGAHESHYLQL
jgi:hypothetical protein